MLFKRLKDKFFNVARFEKEHKALPDQLWPFMWFFLRQEKSVINRILGGEAVLAVIISASFWAVGHMASTFQDAGASLMDTAGLVALAVLFGVGFARTATEIGLGLIYARDFWPHFSNTIRKQSFEKTLRHALGFHQNDFAGRIGNKVMDSGRGIRDIVTSVAGAVWFAAIFTVTNIALMAGVNPLLALPMTIWLGAYLLTLRHFLPKVKKYSAESADLHSKVNGQVQDILANIEAVKMHGNESYETERTNNHFDKVSAAAKRMIMTKWRMDRTISLLNWTMVIGTGVLGVWMTASGIVSVGVAIAMALPMAFQATFQSGWIKDELSGIFENFGVVEEAMHALAKPYTVRNINENVPDLDVSHDTATIEFRNVSFGYEGGKGQQVFKDFNLTIPAGQSVGIVGATGSGKSTLVKLLLRAYDIQDGDILINGQNIAEMEQGTVRRQIGRVAQHSQLFHRSIADNIAYGKLDATMDEIIEAAKIARAHDFISEKASLDSRGNVNYGYDAFVGERGAKLSGGEQQRICIARAVLQNAPILVLDEATSALDTVNERAIQQDLDRIMRNRTTLVIAHRLSTLDNVDRIIVMDRGKIIEDGPPEELLAKGGHYAKMRSQQAGQESQADVSLQIK